jgi:hypothetical protein
VALHEGQALADLADRSSRKTAEKSAQPADFLILPRQHRHGNSQLQAVIWLLLPLHSVPPQNIGYITRKLRRKG